MAQDNHRSLGQQIKLIRMQHGMKQAELGKHLNVVRSTISHWENDRRTPSLDELRRLVSFFDMTLDAFIETAPMGSLIHTEKQQEVILLERLGFSCSVWEHVWVIVAAGIAYLSFWLNDLYSFVTAIFGVLMMVFGLMNMGRTRIQSFYKDRERLVIPHGHTVVIRQLGSDQSLSRLRWGLKIMTLVLFVMSVIIYGFWLVRLLAMPSSILNSIVFLLALATLYFSFKRWLSTWLNHVFQMTQYQKERWWSIQGEPYALPILLECVLLALFATTTITTAHDVLSDLSSQFGLGLWGFYLIISYGLLVLYMKQRTQFQYDTELKR